MNTTVVIFAVILVLAVIGIVLGTFLSRRRAERLNARPGSDYDSALQTMGSEKKIQREQSWMNDKNT
jgi:NADH:ubiquinone oxidoreductase subunit 3 (subunit A)